MAILVFLIGICLGGCGLKEKYADRNLIQTGLVFFHSLGDGGEHAEEMLGLKEIIVYGVPTMMAHIIGYPVDSESKTDVEGDRIGEIAIKFWVKGKNKSGATIKERRLVVVHCVGDLLETTGWKVEKVRFQRLGKLGLPNQIGTWFIGSLLWSLVLGLLLSILTLPLLIFGQAFHLATTFVMVQLVGWGFSGYLSYVYFHSWTFTIIIVVWTIMSFFINVAKKINENR